MRFSFPVVAGLTAALFLLVSCTSPSVTGPCVVDSDSSITLDVEFQLVTSVPFPVPPPTALSERLAAVITTAKRVQSQRPLRIRTTAANDSVMIGMEVPVTWTVDVASAEVNGIPLVPVESDDPPYCETALSAPPRTGYHRRFFTLTPAAPLEEDDLGSLQVTFTTGTIADGVYHPAVFLAPEPDSESECIPVTSFHRVTKGTFGFVNFDLTSSFNADVVVNGTDAIQDSLVQISDASETATLAFATESLVGLGGLPDDGLLTPERVAQQNEGVVIDLPECLPDIQLGFSNDSDGNNAWLQEIEGDALTIDVPDARYAELLFYVTPPFDLESPPDGLIRAMHVEMTYEDTTTTEVATLLPFLGLPLSMPPVAPDAPDLVPSFTMGGGLLVDTSGTDGAPVIPAGIAAMLVTPDTAKTLTSVTITPFLPDLSGLGTPVPPATGGAPSATALEPVKLAVFGAAGLQFQANLAVAKELLTAGPYVVGNAVTYRITVANSGNADSTDVTVTDVLPAQLAYVSATASAGTCGEAGGTVTCDLGVIGAGGSETIDIVANISVAGPFSNTASAAMAGGEADETDNAATTAAVAVGEPNLVVAKSVVTPGPYAAGDIVTYRITVTNDGTDDSTDVTVIDALPDDLRFVSASASDGTCSEAAETVTCQLGVLGTGASETVDIVVTLWDSGVLTNTAEASMVGGEVDTSDNAATAAITAGPAEFEEIPTLSEWALALLGAMLGIAALVRARS